MSRVTVPRGTFDILPQDAARRAALETAARELLEPAGYGRIETPTFEATELFSRTVGEATDIVQKEMYSFTDDGGRSLTLRPEGTAPVCRAYVEHGMHKLPAPVRLYYLSSFFRAERPQAGRYRQFWQLGIEALGSQSGVGGGGRYDGLVEMLGGPPTPGVGWAAGVERMLMAAGESSVPARALDLFVAHVDARADAFATVTAARERGLAAQMELAGRSLKGQHKQAERLGARFVATLEGDGEARLRDQRSGTEETLARTELLDRVARTA